jgi:succinyl-diaminopimelate desuccinylase
VREALAARMLELVDFASESRDEAALAEHVLGLLPGARDGGDTCVLAGVTERGDRPLVLLAGHLDTVPAQGNRPGRREGGVVHGLGASDMKAGVAVMIELALAEAGARSVDLGFVFFGRE